MKSIRRKITLLAITMLLLAGLAFAAGSIEAQDDAFVVRVTEVLVAGDEPVFTVRTEDGSTRTLVADKETVSTLPLSAYAPGDYLEIVTDETSYAKSIRFVSPLVALGYYDVEISKSVVNKPESLENRFSYTYGYMLMKSFASQGLYFNIDYYVRGSLDAIQVAAGKPITEFFSGDDMQAIIREYQDEVWSKNLASQSFGGSGVNELETISEMEKPEELFDRFSYVYGYLVTYSMVSQGLSLNGPYFAYGMLAMGTGDAPILSEEEMGAAMGEMQEKLESEYKAKMAALDEKNSAIAKAFLADNAGKEGVVTTESGLQYLILAESDGTHPTADDTIRFHYILKDIEGKVLQDSHTMEGPMDSPLKTLVQGLQEGISLMGVGATYRFFLPPALAYGETGAGDIEPGQALIFDIDLVAVNPAEEKK